uniref:LysM peptidoglycan-binding domain-containing protein n=1 Tax=Apibacter raozihei TaxID=2500547 RepID=UPI000FE30472
MLTYRVQKGDTLETVANRLGLTIFELRNYHNLHCELCQLIGRELTPKINYILYEPREKTAEKKEMPKWPTC